MPMINELVVAMLACARIGAVHSIVVSGFKLLHVNMVPALLILSSFHQIIQWWLSSIIIIYFFLYLFVFFFSLGVSLQNHWLNVYWIQLVKYLSLLVSKLLLIPNVDNLLYEICSVRLVLIISQMVNKQTTLSSFYLNCNSVCWSVCH